MSKNYAIGKFVSLWWNEGKDGKPGYYSTTVRRKYKDKNQQDVEEKMTLFADDAIRLAMEMQKAAQILLHPREIVRKEPVAEVPEDAAGNTDDIPF